MRFIKKKITTMKYTKHTHLPRILCIIFVVLWFLCILLHILFHDDYRICTICKTWRCICLLLACLFLAIARIINKSEWLYAFVRKNNFNKTVFILCCIFVIPIVAFIIDSSLPITTIDNNDFISHWGTFLSIISIFIGMNVYMGYLGDKERHSFKEFINILSDLFERATPNKDKVYLLLPTLQIGAAGNNKQFSELFKNSIDSFVQQINVEGMELEIGILDYNIKKINTFFEYIKATYPTLMPEKEDNLKELRKNINEMKDNVKFSDLYTDIHSKLINPGGILFLFHKRWYKRINIEDEIFFYLDLAIFLRKLESYQKSNKLKLHKIKQEYFSTQDDEDADKGLFIFDNIGKKQAYCGNIIISSQEQIEFQSLTIKGNEGLCTLFKDLFIQFVNKHIDNSTEDAKN